MVYRQQAKPCVLRNQCIRVMEPFRKLSVWDCPVVRQRWMGNEESAFNCCCKDFQLFFKASKHVESIEK